MSSNPKVRGSSPANQPKKSGAKKSNDRPIVFDSNLFAAGVAGYLRGMDNPAIPQDGNYSSEPAFLQAIEMFEIYYGKVSSEFGDAVTGLAAFQDWLNDTGWEYEEPQLYITQAITITMGMTTPSGSLSVALTVQPTTEDNAAIIRKARIDLQNALNLAFLGTINKHALPETVKDDKPKRGSKNNSKVEYETEEAHIIGLRVKKYEGKLYWNAIPSEGRWTQYGIPLYKDIADKFDIELPEKSGEYDVDWGATYELKEDGKPRRIIEIDAEENSEEYAF